MARPESTVELVVICSAEIRPEPLPHRAEDRGPTLSSESPIQVSERVDQPLGVGVRECFPQLLGEARCVGSDCGFLFEDVVG
jgi:hypothetical protein